LERKIGLEKIGLEKIGLDMNLLYAILVSKSLDSLHLLGALCVLCG
jgi:hypothetical protein